MPSLFLPLTVGALALGGASCTGAPWATASSTRAGSLQHHEAQTPTAA